MKKPPFDPKRARGDLFDAGLFDPTPVARPASPATGAPAASEPEAESRTQMRADERSGPPTTGAGGASRGTSSDASRVASSDASRVASSDASRVASGGASRGTSSGASRAGTGELTVTQFSNLIVRALEDGLQGDFRVQGELANLSKRNHWYFSIKDEKSLLSCVMWQSDAMRVPFEPREGDKVVVIGKIGHFPPQGRTQFYARRIEPQGVGELELRFQRLVKELRELGYFEPSRKKRLPALPFRVGVVTSAGGAALQDVLQTARTRCPAVEFVVVDVRVQGDGAADEVARALRALDRRRGELGLDAVIVTRGGGSREDLWAFNERVVADAVHAMRLPVVAAIGHEVDTTVVELVADLRASTPTQAVMMLLPDLEDLVQRRERLEADLARAMRWSFQSRREALLSLAGSVERLRPDARVASARGEVAALAGRAARGLDGCIASRRRTLDEFAVRLARAAPAQRAAAARATLAGLAPWLSRALGTRIARDRAALAGLAPRLSRELATRLARDQAALTALARRMRSAGPEETLQRGYAIVTDARGALVRAAGARTGDALVVRVADGSLAARVERVDLGGASGGAPGDGPNPPTENRAGQ